jgi:hypothetical protein
MFKRVDGPMEVLMEAIYLGVADFCSNAPAGCTFSDMRLGPESGWGSPAPLISRDSRYAVFEQFFSDINFRERAVVLQDTCIGAASGCVPHHNVAKRSKKSWVRSKRIQPEWGICRLHLRRWVSSDREYLYPGGARVLNGAGGHNCRCLLGKPHFGFRTVGCL